MNVTLHDEHTIAVDLGRGWQMADKDFVKALPGSEWGGKDDPRWFVALRHIAALRGRFPAAQVDGAVLAADVAGDEGQAALNFVAPYLRNGAHTLHLNTATGCVWLEGPAVDEQSVWIAEQIAPYVPALRRMCERQRDERAACDISQLSQGK